MTFLQLLAVLGLTVLTAAVAIGYAREVRALLTPPDERRDRPVEVAPPRSA